MTRLLRVLDRVTLIGGMVGWLLVLWASALGCAPSPAAPADACVPWADTTKLVLMRGNGQPADTVRVIARHTCPT